MGKNINRRELWKTRRGKGQNHAVPVCVRRRVLPLHKEDTSLLSEGDTILGREADTRIQPVTVPGPEGTTGL